MGDGLYVASLTREEAKKLQDKRMVVPTRRRGNVWLALECAAIIKAELRRKISPTLPIAEDNYTIRVVACSQGGGCYFELKHEMINEAWGRPSHRQAA
jgi:hypothetical protein